MCKGYLWWLDNNPILWMCNTGLSDLVKEIVIRQQTNQYIQHGNDVVKLKLLSKISHQHFETCSILHAIQK